MEEIWGQKVVGCRMFVLSQKLKNLKELRLWNKKVFGDVNLKVDQAQVMVDDLQHLISSLGHNDALYDQEKLAQADLQQALLFQESFWREKSRVNTT